MSEPQTGWRTDSVETFSQLPVDEEKEAAFRKRKEASKALLDAAVAPLVEKHEKASEVEDKTPFLDLVRNQLPGISPAQRAIWRKEDYEARRAQALGTSEKKPSQADIAAAQAEVDRINNYFDSQHEDEVWDDDE